MALFKLSADQNVLNRFKETFKRSRAKKLKNALFEIQREFKLEFDRQQQRLHRSGWAPWSTAYSKRRDSEFSKPRITRFKSKLKRTGAMMAGYIQGVVIDEQAVSVTAGFPKGKVGVRAKAHQGVTDRPKGVPVRPFQLDRFNALAFKIFEKAIREGK